MTLETDFVAGSMGGKFLDHASYRVGNDRWEDARQRHLLSYGREVPGHPVNFSHTHYARRYRLGTLVDAHLDPEFVLAGEKCDWLPVRSCIFESYGDLNYRIRMLFALPGSPRHGSFNEVRRRTKADKSGHGALVRSVGFHAVQDGTRIERRWLPGSSPRPAITHEVLGFEITQGASDSTESLWCPEGLAQALTVLAEINGSGELVGPGLVTAGIDLISQHEYQELAAREFDRGEP